MTTKQISSIRSNTGATLVIALVMLIVLTVIVVSAIRISSVNLRIAGNMQTIANVTASAQQGIDTFIATSTNFTAAPSTNTTIPVSTSGVTVTVKPPKCINTYTDAGYDYEFSAGGAVGDTSSSAPQSTMWDIYATATDSLTNASITVHQGVKIRLPPGSTCAN
ncbi:uncharacterized protein NMK_1433 [Novimethylophilus kurashikiensis]|uniref:Type 4 fimbrial biogenesis protein PilX N-terminal domain-containing protein n=1 Tax=Novimethylophilus kurashikiensis TaxID=1825523 RepID=A0A2R5FB18_9PROT|nr:pilus assembly PilX N-terminal domain-containing protein [Novimethylophilus kurashikiensis]GBG13881.1 uncharacterized protein NMK_1433 [Novimethylophilus kurashikiensis]